MAGLDQIAGQGQIQEKVQLQQQSLAQLQTQNIIMMTTQELDQRIDMELEFKDPLMDEDDASDLQGDDDDQWDPNFDKPIDEYETGDRYTEEIFDVDSNISVLERIAVERWSDDPERLKKALKAIDDYRISEIMSDPILAEVLFELESAPWNQKSLPNHPDIEVIIDNGQVEVCLTHNKLDYSKSKTGMGKDTTTEQALIKDIGTRKIFLQKLCDLVLSELQKDFFLDKNDIIPLLTLIPISIPDLCELIPNDLFTTQLSFEKFIYRTENLIVSCSHGNFPFNIFLPNETSLLLLWMKEAEKNGKIKQKDQLEWITEHLERRVNAWPSEDRRRGFIQSLMDIKIDHIKYANKKAKRGKA